MSGHYVQLCNNPLRFEPVTKENSVFFDESNRQVRLKYNSYNNYVLYFLRSQHYFLTFTCYNTKYILQVFSVTSGEGKTHVVVRGPDIKSVAKFLQVYIINNRILFKYINSLSISSPCVGNPYSAANVPNA